MKSHYIRTLNQLGTVTIPADYRKELGLFQGSQLSISIKGETIVIEPMKKRNLCSAKEEGRE